MEATHSLESRGQVSSVGTNIQLTTEATHFLESQGQGSSAGSKSKQKLHTPWRAKDRGRQQGPNPAHHGSHSHPGWPRTGRVSRGQSQLITEATHPLERQGQLSSARTKSSSPQKPLTFWRAEDSHHQQGPNPAHHRSHSPSGDPRIGVVSRDQIQLITKATHILKSRGHILSVGLKLRSSQKPLTNWRPKDRHCQQGTNPAHHQSRSQTGE